MWASAPTFETPTLRTPNLGGPVCFLRGSLLPAKGTEAPGPEAHYRKMIAKTSTQGYRIFPFQELFTER